jgi:hypothetical protein
MPCVVSAAAATRAFAIVWGFVKFVPLSQNRLPGEREGEDPHESWYTELTKGRFV